MRLEKSRPPASQLPLTAPATHSDKISEVYLRDLESRFEDVLKTKVRIKLLSEGSGWLQIEFYSAEDFERMAKKVGVVLAND